MKSGTTAFLPFLDGKLVEMWLLRRSEMYIFMWLLGIPEVAYLAAIFI